MSYGSNLVVLTGISLAACLCTQRGAAQITIGNVVTAPDLTQPVAGDCANYDSVLSNTGVSANGQTHPGRCRSSAITPLFDGAPLGTNMQAFLNSHRGLFTVKAVPGRVGCEAVSKITVALSASLQATRLEWSGAPVVGAKCSNEVARVNASFHGDIVAGLPSRDYDETSAGGREGADGHAATERVRPQPGNCNACPESAGVESLAEGGQR